MGAYDYRRVEGILYDLSGTAQARPSASRPGLAPPVRSRPSGPPAAVVPRLDVALAVRRLEPADRAVLTQHYVRGAHVPYRQRTHAVRRLVVLLGSLDSADD